MPVRLRGYGFGCAVMDDGTGRCWGENGGGQLGTGTPSFKELAPLVVSGLAGALEITPGGGHACARLANQTVACWGFNLAGQLGDGTTTQRQTPVQVLGLSGIVRIAAGDAASCAIEVNGRLWCWGNNGIGQLGDGTIDNRTAPTAVVW
jgi:alpha-tubulin suppressor-like RCC1 family protein